MTRTIAIIGLFCGLAALAVPPATARQAESTLWITLGEIDQLVEADPYTFKEIRRITTDPRLHGLAISADGSRIYVASDKTGNFQVIDARQGIIVNQVQIGKDPNQLTLTRDGRLAYVPLRGEDAIAIVQLEPLALLKKIPTPKGPHDAYTSSDGSRIFVGAQFGNAVIVLDPAKQSLLYNLPTADGVRPLAPTKDGRTVYAALSNLLGFVVLDSEKGVTRRVELGTLPDGLPRPYLDTFTHALHLSPDERELWVSDCINDLIRIVSLPDMRETGQIRVGHFPHWFTMRPDGKVLFVSLWYSDAVAAIDIASRKVLHNIQFARQSGPKRIAIAPKVR
ncbi:MAG TPA: beta-propeller fold lactonase family protein [Vicinamibacterales bacterium]|nr:beta-propeller fold lactonase family protein [Vicinamibacterales bacterium]